MNRAEELQGIMARVEKRSKHRPGYFKNRYGKRKPPQKTVQDQQSSWFRLPNEIRLHIAAYVVGSTTASWAGRPNPTVFRFSSPMPLLLVSRKFVYRPFIVSTAFNNRVHSVHELPGHKSITKNLPCTLSVHQRSARLLRREHGLSNDYSHVAARQDYIDSSSADMEPPFQIDWRTISISCGCYGEAYRYWSWPPDLVNILQHYPRVKTVQIWLPKADYGRDSDFFPICIFALSHVDEQKAREHSEQQGLYDLRGKRLVLDEDTTSHSMGPMKGQSREIVSERVCLEGLGGSSVFMTLLRSLIHTAKQRGVQVEVMISLFFIAMDTDQFNCAVGFKLDMSRMELNAKVFGRDFIIPQNLPKDFFDITPTDTALTSADVMENRYLGTEFQKLGRREVMVHALSRNFRSQ